MTEPKRAPCPSPGIEEIPVAGKVVGAPVASAKDFGVQGARIVGQHDEQAARLQRPANGFEDAERIAQRLRPSRIARPAWWAIAMARRRDGERGSFVRVSAPQLKPSHARSRVALLHIPTILAQREWIMAEALGAAASPVGAAAGQAQVMPVQRFDVVPVTPFLPHSVFHHDVPDIVLVVAGDVTGFFVVGECVKRLAVVRPLQDPVGSRDDR